MKTRLLPSSPKPVALIAIGLLVLAGIAIALVSNNAPRHPAQQIALDGSGSDSIDNDNDGNPDGVEFADNVLSNRADYVSDWTVLPCLNGIPVPPGFFVACPMHFMHFLGGDYTKYNVEFFCKGSGGFAPYHQPSVGDPMIMDINSQGIKIARCRIPGCEYKPTVDECTEYQVRIWKIP